MLNEPLRLGQNQRGREPVLSGEDGVHSRGAQEHLQAEGDPCRQPVKEPPRIPRIKEIKEPQTQLDSHD